MTLEERASTHAMRVKLRLLYDHYRHPHPRIYEFGTYLAERLPDTVTPPEFVETLDSAIDAFRARSVADEPNRWPARQVGHDDAHYAQLRRLIPNMAHAVCSAGFARAVHDVYVQIYPST